jgi:Oxidoreductase family, C-terminal alpha/beta domain
VFDYDFIPQGKGQAISRSVKPDEEKGLEQFPEDRTEKDLEKHCAPAIRGHMQDFLTAIANRGKPIADIEQGTTSSISCILANVSMQLGRTLEWDLVENRVVDDSEANKLLRRSYRRPWTHPEPEKV